MKTEHPVEVGRFGGIPSDQITLSSNRGGGWSEDVLTKEEAIDLAIRILQAVQELP